MSDLWTRRRAAAAQDRDARAQVSQRNARAARDADLAAMPEEEALRELGLPAPEGLEKGDDFAAFLREGVPEWLKRRALRRLWRVNPVLANVDGLVDYGHDYTDAATVVPNMATAYEVGRGMVAKVEKVITTVDADEPAPEPDEPMTKPEPETLVAVAPSPDAPQDDPPARPLRRMAFAFEDDSA